VVTSFIDLSGSRDVIAWSFPIDHFLLVVLWNEASGISPTVSEIFNGECDRRNGWRDLNTTSKQGQSVLAVVICVLHRRDSWSFLEREQNMETEALPSKDLVSGTVYLLRWELQTGSEIFNDECDAMIDTRMTLIWPLNKRQGHLFWHQSISHITSYSCQ